MASTGAVSTSLKTRMHASKMYAGKWDKNQKMRTVTGSQCHPRLPVDQEPLQTQTNELTPR